MSRHLSLTLVGSLLVVFSFTAAGPVRADWLIDSTGTLVKVKSVAALYGSLPVVAEVGDLVDPQPVDDPVENLVDPQLVEGKDGGVPAGTPKKGGPQAPKTPPMELLLQEQAKEKKTFEAQVQAREKTLQAKQQQITSQVEAVNGEIVVTQEVKDNKGQTVKEEKVTLPKEEKLHVAQDEGDTLEIEVSEDEDTLKLKDGSTPTRTRTHNPIGISADGTLTITHKDGTSKEVAVLPEAALGNLEAKGFTAPTEVELAVEDKKPVYKGEAGKKEYFLGIKHPAFEVKLDRFQVKISAVDGTVESSSERLTAWQKILDRLSF